MMEQFNKLQERLNETGEELVELMLTENVSIAIVTDDTGDKLTLEYNEEEGIWE